MPRKSDSFSPFIVISADVAGNNIKVLRFAMEVQKCVPFALLSSYDIIFRIAVNKILNTMSVLFCVLALVIRRTNSVIYAPLYVAIFGQSGCSIFLHIIS